MEVSSVRGALTEYVESWRSVPTAVEKERTRKNALERPQISCFLFTLGEFWDKLKEYEKENDVFLKGN